METKTILVTGIGGNVGQGIIRNILGTGYPVRIIGTNITAFSAGNHLVDVFYKTPFGYEPDYITVIKHIVEQEKVDLIIPSTDFESYYLALAELPCKVSGSSAEVSGIYLDKYLTFLNHKKTGIAFAESCLPSEYKVQFAKALAKPRKGRGSRGLIFNVTDISLLIDEEYMIQELHTGTEITTAVYRRYSDGEVHGLITMERSLENGATTYCKVVDEYDKQVWEIVKAMCNNQSGLKGAFNIQSIVTKDGKIVPFEINCRISGTNSIRSGFGFKDVQYTIEELLWNIKPEKPQITKGIAYRYLADVIYPDASTLKGNNFDKFKVF